MGKFALLIGVSEYLEGENPLSALPAALNDVRALEAVLIDPNLGEFTPDHVTVLENPSPYIMRSKIEALFQDRSQDDLVLLYFSGHGITDQQNKFFFATPKTRKNAKNVLVKSTAISAQDVYDYMNDCDSQRMVLILDCCHSGAFGDWIPRDAEKKIGFEAQLGGRGRIVLTASGAIDYSYERSGEELAVYTQYLIEGMKTGDADRDEDGYVSVDELHDYVVEKLAETFPDMSPQRYVVQDGEKIKLTRAIVIDPTQRYRKAVQKYSHEGVIRPAGRWNLEIARLKLNLTSEDAETIETDELHSCDELDLRRKYHDMHLAEYEKCFRDELEATGGILDDYSRKNLNELAYKWSLRTPNVHTIEQIAIEEFQRKLIEINRPRNYTSIVVDQSQSSTQTTKYQLKPFLEDLWNEEKIFGDGAKLEMIPIPAGDFLMGSPKSEVERSPTEDPQHIVQVAPFYIGKFPITQEQWIIIAKTKEINCKLDINPSAFKGFDLPVERVSWYDAVEFCKRLSRETGKLYRLPSEAQWEYACRAKAKVETPFHFGETIDATISNYDGNYSYGSGVTGEYRQKTTPVGYFKIANEFGLYDMHGNVYEWCQDPWHKNYEGAPIDGSVWNTFNASASKVLRGGSWIHLPRNCRSAYRHHLTPYYRDKSIGFRVVCIIQDLQ